MNKLLRLSAVAAISLCALCGMAQTSPEPFKPSTFYTQRATLFDALPVDTTDIVMLGNSITNGCEWSELFGRTGIHNRGISGDITDGVLHRLGSVVKGSPAKVFLLIGINDLARNRSTGLITGNIFTIVDSIRTISPRTQVYVQSILPVNPAFGMFEGHTAHKDDIPVINAALAAGTAAHGYTFIDLFTSFASPEGVLDPTVTNDGLHLLGAGYIRWRDLLLPYLD